MKERDSFSVIDCGEPVALTRVEITPEGEVRWSASGRQVVPAAAWNETSYERPKGPKVLNRLPLDPKRIQIDDVAALAGYRTLLAVDTNTIRVAADLISVAAVVRAEVFERTVRWGHVEAIELRNALGNPERVAWRLVISAHLKAAARPAAVIVDSELGLLHRINARSEPVENGFFLPEGWSVIYGSADAGREMIPNRLIGECDRRAAKVLKDIAAHPEESRSLADAPADETFRQIRVWRYAG